MRRCTRLVDGVADSSEGTVEDTAEGVAAARAVDAVGVVDAGAADVGAAPTYMCTHTALPLTAER